MVLSNPLRLPKTFAISNRPITLGHALKIDSQKHFLKFREPVKNMADILQLLGFKG